MREILFIAYHFLPSSLSLSPCIYHMDPCIVKVRGWDKSCSLFSLCLCGGVCVCVWVYWIAARKVERSSGFSREEPLDPLLCLELRQVNCEFQDKILFNLYTNLITLPSSLVILNHGMRSREEGVGMLEVFEPLSLLSQWRLEEDNGLLAPLLWPFSSSSTLPDSFLQLKCAQSRRRWRK